MCLVELWPEQGNDSIPPLGPLVGREGKEHQQCNEPRLRQKPIRSLAIRTSQIHATKEKQLDARVCCLSQGHSLRTTVMAKISIARS